MRGSSAAWRYKRNRDGRLKYIQQELNFTLIIKEFISLRMIGNLNPETVWLGKSISYILCYVPLSSH
jgi:hypothetical protein